MHLKLLGTSRPKKNNHLKPLVQYSPPQPGKCQISYPWEGLIHQMPGVCLGRGGGGVEVSIWSAHKITTTLPILFSIRSLLTKSRNFVPRLRVQSNERVCSMDAINRWSKGTLFLASCLNLEKKLPGRFQVFPQRPGEQRKKTGELAGLS